MRRALLRVASSCAFAFVALFAATPADAHVAPPLMRADRTLTLTLGERVVLDYVVRLSAPELSRVRHAGDADHDGQLSRAESDGVLAGFRGELVEKVRYASGAGSLGPFGRLAAAHSISTEATGLEGPNDISERAPGARISWSFDLRIAGGDDRVTIEDAAAFVTFDHSEVFVRDTASRRFLGLGDVPQRMTPATQLAWVDAGKPSPGGHTIAVTWTLGASDKRPLLLIAILLGGIAIAVVTVLSVRRP